MQGQRFITKTHERQLGIVGGAPARHQLGMLLSLQLIQEGGCFLFVQEDRTGLDGTFDIRPTLFRDVVG